VDFHRCMATQIARLSEQAKHRLRSLPFNDVVSEWDRELARRNSDF
jgi:hypothetical protein